MKILLVEDDKDLAETISDKLSRTYSIDVAHTGAEGLKLASNRQYDVMILDIKLPDQDGISVCRTIRAQHITSPILMLTARAAVDQKVTALNEGADDYLTKPFNFDELSARLKALLRRPTNTFVHNVLKVGSLTIDLQRHRVEWRGKEVKLRRKEFLLLEYLARHQGQVVTRQMILDHVWDSSSSLFSNTVDVHINSLRQKIDKPFRTQLIHTVPGIGYKLQT